jgi:hypothetical protein
MHVPRSANGLLPPACPTPPQSTNPSLLPATLCTSSTASATATCHNPLLQSPVLLRIPADPAFSLLPHPARSRTNYQISFFFPFSLHRPQPSLIARRVPPPASTCRILLPPPPTIPHVHICASMLALLRSTTLLCHLMNAAICRHTHCALACRPSLARQGHPCRRLGAACYLYHPFRPGTPPVPSFHPATGPSSLTSSSSGRDL